jgi:hypothetical protein
MKTARIFLITAAALLFRGIAAAQSLEYYAGNKRTGVDLLLFKNFKNARDQKTPFLFFSRNRAGVDYHNAPAVFASTSAVSYNFKNGMGIVGIASFLNAGFTPKAGIQYFKQTGSFMFFGWLVADVKKKGNIDLFALFRFQPGISRQWKFFGQVELFPLYNPANKFWNITQRIRLGGRLHAWAGGLMLDFNQQGITSFTTTENAGVFFRYEF